MAKYVHLNNAPIREAVIEIRLAPSDIGLDQLDAVGTKLKAEFENREEIRKQIFSLGTSPKITDTGVHGLRFSSKGSSYIIQAREDGFALSHLPKFGTSEKFISDAKKFWGVFSEQTKPKGVTRVGVRFISVIAIPPGAELSEYFTAPPTLPDNIHVRPTAFLSRVSLANEKQKDLRATLTTASEGLNMVSEKSDVVVDYDVCTEFHGSSPSTSDLWKKVKDLMEWEKEMFFSSVTERTIDLYK